MDSEQIQYGHTETHWSASGTRILKYSLEIYHKGLKEHKIISAPELDVLERKVVLQVEKWKEKWLKRQLVFKKESKMEQANSKTLQSQEALKQIDNLLISSLSVDTKINWDSLKKNDSPPKQPIKPQYKKSPAKPDKFSFDFIPTFSFWERLIKSKKRKKISEYDEKYLKAIEEWEKKESSVKLENNKIEEEFQGTLDKWNREVDKFSQKQADYNAKIDLLKQSYLNQNHDAIIEYCEMVLNKSSYPDSFLKNFELEYNIDTKILIVEYELPSIECLPKVKDVKYIASRKEFKESILSDSQVNKMFDDTMYKITLRTLYELFQADVANALEAISFNGWVKAINKATGKEETNCILSIQVKKIEFLDIELSNVSPKICFRNLKGVASSKLNTLTAVQPILKIDKSDSRFVESYSVTDAIDNTTNLAAMDWEDFEHLIRELFEKEFQSNGGEVKVTQASRDGGVDAIAFDPDPIRGGKIVIQAKRYTNTVGVSAVRDLYGTVLNEGAIKGILVSTANYGSDAYDFAKDKPLTLLNGSNLLHLLEKHGQHAKIDLKEAKQILSQNDKKNR